MWLFFKKFRNKYKLTPQHFYALKKAGKVKYKQIFDCSYLYEDNLRTFDDSIAIYARVSTPKAKERLGQSSWFS